MSLNDNSTNLFSIFDEIESSIMSSIEEDVNIISYELDKLIASDIVKM